jgi:hypothetical protein
MIHGPAPTAHVLPQSAVGSVVGVLHTEPVVVVDARSGAHGTRTTVGLPACVGTAAPQPAAA